MRLRLLLTVSIVTAACVQHPPVPARSSAVGDWSLASVNGQMLPFTVFQQGDYQSALASITLRLDATGAFVFTSHNRETMGANVSETSKADSGTYVQRDSALTLRFASDSLAVTATINQGSLTLVQRGGTYRFARASSSNQR